MEPENLQDLESANLPSVQPENHMTMSIIGTVLGLFSPCCIGIILGIIAIVMSSQVKTKFLSGDVSGAISSSKNAKILGIIAIVLGILGIIISVITIMFYGGIDGYMEQYQELFKQFD